MNAPIDIQLLYVPDQIHPSTVILTLKPRPPKLALLDPWNNADKHQHTGNNHSPELDVQHIRIEASLRSCADRGERHRQDDIAADAVVLVYCLALVHTSKDLLWNVELSKADKSLAEDQDVGDQAHNAVRACESSLRVAGFVHFDYNQAGYQGHYAHKIKSEVDVCAIHFLFPGAGRL